MSARPQPKAPPRHAPHVRRAPFLVMVVGLIVAAMSALLALNTASAANELSRHDIAARDQTVAAQVVALQNDAAASSAPGNLAAAAESLGMVLAGNPAFLEIGPDGTGRVLGSAAPAYPPPVYVKPRPTKTRSAKKAPRTTTKTGTKAAPKTAPKTAPAGSHATSSTSPGAARSSTADPTRSASGAHSSSGHASPRPTPTTDTTLPGGTR